ncbi:MAG: IclR family transcriptional regulator C-terminal domain-containing protein [Pseudomonadota bacterium]
MGNRDGASTFAKGLRVLECFQDGRLDMSMADIARMTGFDRATARRLCLTLEDCGYLIKSNRTYHLSPKIVVIAGGFLTSHDIGKWVQPVLNQYAEEMSGEIALAVRDDLRAIYIARSAVASARLSLGFSVGSTLPLLSTSIGRMLLASTPDGIRETFLLASEPQKHTQATLTDLGAIREKIDEAARLGFSYVEGEFELGAAGLAVPAHFIGNRQAVLGTTASANQFARPGELDRMLDILRRAAMSLRR